MLVAALFKDIYPLYRNVDVELVELRARTTRQEQLISAMQAQMDQLQLQVNALLASRGRAGNDQVEDRVAESPADTLS